MNIHKLNDGFNSEPYRLEKFIKRLFYHWAVVDGVNNIEVFTSVVVVKNLADNNDSIKRQNI